LGPGISVLRSMVLLTWAVPPGHAPLLRTPRFHAWAWKPVTTKETGAPRESPGSGQRRDDQACHDPGE
jgi:hypothetical protein